MRTFQRLLAGFLLERIPRRRNLSPNAAKGCRDSLALLLEWLAAVGGTSPDAIGIGDLGREGIEALCAWLGDVRGSAPAAVSVRLSAPRSFAGHVSLAEPAHVEWASGIREIRLSKAPSREVGFLGADAVAVTIGSAAGDARGHAPLSLLYDSGARVSETSFAVRSDVRPKSPATIRLMGKGGEGPHRSALQSGGGDRRTPHGSLRRRSGGTPVREPLRQARRKGWHGVDPLQAR